MDPHWHRAFLVASSVLVLGGVVIACSSSTETVASPSQVSDGGSDAVDEEEPVAAIDAGATTCELPSDLRTGVKTCDDCLQKRCCQVIVTCFDDTACTAMNDCYNGCRTNPGDAGGTACVKECAAKDNAAAEKLVDMLECQSSRCGTECKG